MFNFSYAESQKSDKNHKTSVFPDMGINKNNITSNSVISNQNNE